ncbi:hypothetical protein EC957_000450 [Mortierella hygrophila]|uniref:FHA domain-containing protein n=1 Tax=Mortierella hygrophila TaxID=979708 RepID=A0A9P6K309_9FUNG|nr:hypothetical protein EC957_000450 [Mortierella hygrophila]
MNTDDGEKAVAKLKISSQFDNQPVRIFYLYKGINSVGRDPNLCNVWLTENFICRVHMYINVQDEFIFIRDGVKRPGKKPTTLSASTPTTHIMERDDWYQCTQKMGYITPEQQTAIYNGTHMDETFVGE